MVPVACVMVKRLSTGKQHYSGFQGPSVVTHCLNMFAVVWRTMKRLLGMAAYMVAAQQALQGNLIGAGQTKSSLWERLSDMWARDHGYAHAMADG